jgi:hypothetical protein
MTIGQEPPSQKPSTSAKAGLSQATFRRPANSIASAGGLKFKKVATATATGNNKKIPLLKKADLHTAELPTAERSDALKNRIQKKKEAWKKLRLNAKLNRTKAKEESTSSSSSPEVHRAHQLVENTDVTTSLFEPQKTPPPISPLTIEALRVLGPPTTGYTANGSSISFGDFESVDIDDINLESILLDDLIEH